jgi:hypothetical protein
MKQKCMTFQNSIKIMYVAVNHCYREIVIKCAIWWLLLVVLEMKLFCRAVNVLFENNFNLSRHELKTLFGRIGSVKFSRLDMEL